MNVSVGLRFFRLEEDWGHIRTEKKIKSVPPHHLRVEDLRRERGGPSGDLNFSIRALVEEWGFQPWEGCNM